MMRKAIVCFVVLSFVAFGSSGPACSDEDILVVSEAGKVGIGTAAPTFTLSVNALDKVGFYKEGTYNVGFRISFNTENNSASLTFRDISQSNSNYQTVHLEAKEWYFKSGGNSHTAMNILGDGKVGIGHYLDPQYLLDVNGVVRCSDVIETSDASLKKNVQALKGSLERVIKLKGVNFQFADSARDARMRMGLIAQEVEAIFPEAVYTDGRGSKSVSYTKLVAPMIEAIKELHSKNKALKSEVKAYQSRVGLLEARTENLEKQVLKLTETIRKFQ